jgi:hypothetical protein
MHGTKANLSGSMAEPFVSTRLASVAPAVAAVDSTVVEVAEEDTTVAEVAMVEVVVDMAAVVVRADMEAKVVDMVVARAAMEVVEVSFLFLTLLINPQC